MIINKMITNINRIFHHCKKVCKKNAALIAAFGINATDYLLAAVAEAVEAASAFAPAAAFSPHVAGYL